MFTEEQQAAIDKQIQDALTNQASAFEVEKESAIAGLKATNQALKDEKQAEIEAKKAIELKAAEEAGDHQKVLQMHTEEAEKVQASYGALKDTLINNDQELAVSGLASHMINNDMATKRLLGTMAKSSLGEDGQITRSYTDFNGQQVATDEKGFLDWASKDATMRNYLSGSKAQGGGANGSSGNNAPADTLEACGGDRAKEAEYFNRQLQG